jgi:uncharacterized protein
VWPWHAHCVETGSDPGVVVLAEDACWRLLSTVEVGRLALVVADEPEIFPVNFVVDGHSVVFRTAEGTKLFGLTARPRVAFEADGYDADTGHAWSVVVKGTAIWLEKSADIYAVDELPLTPWQPGTKPWYVRISRTTVSGIEFTVVESS